MTNFVKILRIRYENIPLFYNGYFEFSFMAEDRVSDPTQVFQLRKNLYTQKLTALVGINASGKTSALKLIDLAMEIVLYRANLNRTTYGKEVLSAGTKIIIDFCDNNTCYELCSTIGTRKSSQNIEVQLYFQEEILFEKALTSIKSKKDILDFSHVKSTYKRSDLPKEVQRYLRDDDSMVIGIPQNSPVILRSLMEATNINYLLQKGTTAKEILHALDANLDELTVTESDDSFTYTVKFKNSSQKLNINDPWKLASLVSSGTIKGQNMISYIEDVLQTGGYLIVDELENHMNKELVRMIMNIFKNNRINKNGACLIFSTHYAEILDFMDRKDNIYITRRNQIDSSSELLNYASEVKRNDVKKSDVILSNYIEGTAPSYESIRALEDYLCSKMD